MGHPHAPKYPRLTQGPRATCRQVVCFHVGLGTRPGMCVWGAAGPLSAWSHSVGPVATTAWLPLQKSSEGTSVTGQRRAGPQLVLGSRQVVGWWLAAWPRGICPRGTAGHCVMSWGWPERPSSRGGAVSGAGSRAALARQVVQAWASPRELLQKLSLPLSRTREQTKGVGAGPRSPAGSGHH